MTPLRQILQNRIQANGSLSFADFMEAALYDPEHGYYSSGNASIGRSGDFYTSVSVGPLFGRLLARQFAEMWERLDCPGVFTLVEQGAFDARLALDVLEALREQSPQCFEAVQFWIVEPHAPLEQRQRETLFRFSSKTHWATSVPMLPQFEGVHFSNELLDAFPCHRLQFQGGEWRELRVVWRNEDFHWETRAIQKPELHAAAARLPEAEEGFRTEVCLGHADWISQVGDTMERGWLLCVDYGMTHEELMAPHRREGTASAYRKHQRVDNLLAEPGLQDLTFQVNFSALAESAAQAGWKVDGYTEQQRFLTGLAPLHFRDATRPPSVSEQKELLAFRTLTHPQMLGGRFKVLCLSRNIPEETRISGLAHARPLDPKLGK